jgi:hypothetical protein
MPQPLAIMVQSQKVATHASAEQHSDFALGPWTVFTCCTLTLPYDEYGVCSSFTLLSAGLMTARVEPAVSGALHRTQVDTNINPVVILFLWSREQGVAIFVLCKSIANCLHARSRACMWCLRKLDPAWRLSCRWARAIHL